MRMRTNQQGYSLLALLIMVMMFGFASLEFRNEENFRQKLLLEQHARETQTLEQIRTSLLGYAANQGLHSQSHLGHLPCPALLPGGPSQTACLNKAWGYLPVQSKIAVNYLNAGIDARFNDLELSSNSQWQYAVSSQLIQPNALGWGRWVDYAQPAIQIRIPAENKRIKTNLAAVIAKTITPIEEHQYDISPPYILLHVNELQKHMKQVQSHQIKTTLRAWQQLSPQFNFSTAVHENMVRTTSDDTYQPLDSACQCRCTKTRCNCHCNNSGHWASPAPCIDNNPNCADKVTQTDCLSTTDAACLFAGPAGLKSGWPVSHFEPIAAINKSCRPTQSNQCPLSLNNVACVCHFSWPNNTLSSLDQFSFTLPSTP